MVWDCQNLLLAQYHSLDVFKLSLQLADLTAVQRRVKAARGIRRGAQICEAESAKKEESADQPGPEAYFPSLRCDAQILERIEFSPNASDV